MRCDNSRSWKAQPLDCRGKFLLRSFVPTSLQCLISFRTTKTGAVVWRYGICYSEPSLRVYCGHFRGFDFPVTQVVLNYAQRINPDESNTNFCKKSDGILERLGHGFPWNVAFPFSHCLFCGDTVPIFPPTMGQCSIDASAAFFGLYQSNRYGTIRLFLERQDPLRQECLAVIIALRVSV
jgi:hypothetical protein